MTDQPTPTLRTDAQLLCMGDWGYSEVVDAAFARELERELSAERALADRLAEALRDIEGRTSDATITLHPDADAKGCVDDCWEWSEQALAAWKEARRG